MAESLKKLASTLSGLAMGRRRWKPPAFRSRGELRCETHSPLRRNCILVGVRAVVMMHTRRFGNKLKAHAGQEKPAHIKPVLLGVQGRNARFLCTGASKAPSCIHSAVATKPEHEGQGLLLGPSAFWLLLFCLNSKRASPGKALCFKPCLFLMRFSRGILYWTGNMQRHSSVPDILALCSEITTREGREPGTTRGRDRINWKLEILHEPKCYTTIASAVLACEVTQDFRHQE